MRGANGGRLRARGAGCGARGARGASGRSRGWAREAAGGRSRGWVTPLGCSSQPASWSTERVVRRCKTGKSHFFPASARVETAVVSVCPGRQLSPLRLPRLQQRTTRSVVHQLGGLLPTTQQSLHSTTSRATANRISAKPERLRQAGISRQREKRYRPALIS